MKKTLLLLMLFSVSVVAAKAARALVEKTRADIAAVLAREAVRHG